jgi:hypothetical protein
MSVVCLRCDWNGEQDRPACPRCGAPLYRRAAGPAAPQRAAARGDPPPAAGDRSGPAPGPRPADEDRDVPGDGWTEPLPGSVRAPASARAVLASVAAVFGVILLLLALGSPEPVRPPAPAPTPSAGGGPGGILVYASPDGSGASRLGLWDLARNRVREGPLIRDPVELVNVRSPSYGWLGVTTDLGDGVREAAVLDSLGPDSLARTIGAGEVVTWAREGGSVILVERGPLLDACRRRVRIVAVHLDKEGREVVVDRETCGDVPTVGRTSLGYFVTWQRPGGADVVDSDIVGAGYDDAGLLLRDHALLSISPGGDMLVTPWRRASRDRPAGSDPAPVQIRGEAFVFSMFGGPPQPIRVSGVPLLVDRVLAYAPGATRALVVGRVGGREPGLWEVPLDGGADPGAPRFLGSARRATWACYAADGTAFVVSGGRVWTSRGDGLVPLELPAGAPAPGGPIAWILREPLADL